MVFGLFKKVKECAVNTYQINPENIGEFLKSINIPFVSGGFTFYNPDVKSESVRIIYNINEDIQFVISDSYRNQRQELNKKIADKNINLADISKEYHEIYIKLKNPGIVIPDSMTLETSLFKQFLNHDFDTLKDMHLESFWLDWNCAKIVFDAWIPCKQYIFGDAIIENILKQSVKTEKYISKLLKNVRNYWGEDHPMYRNFENTQNLEKLQQLTELFNNLRANFEVENSEPKI